MISRIYGCFTISTDTFDKVDVIVMENRNIVTHKNNQSMTFDIKGSKQGRKVNFYSAEQRWWQKSLNQGKLMKDMNFMEINKAYDK